MTDGMIGAYNAVAKELREWHQQRGLRMQFIDYYKLSWPLEVGAVGQCNN
jgi:hypothetical protein